MPRTIDRFHDSCVAEAERGFTNCFYTNNKGKTMRDCRKEQWDAYPACVKNLQKPPYWEIKPDAETMPKEDECTSEKGTTIEPKEDAITELKEVTMAKPEEDKKPKLEEVKKTKAEKDERTSSAFKR